MILNGVFRSRPNFVYRPMLMMILLLEKNKNNLLHLLIIYIVLFPGLTKMKLLPRHLFGLVQSKLFPKCFFMGICLTTVALVTFTLQNPYATWQGDAKFQVNVTAADFNYQNPCFVGTLPQTLSSV